MKILVTGHSGSGKTTKAKELSSSLGLPVHHIDDTPEWREFHKLFIGASDLWFKLYKAFSEALVERALGMEGDLIIEGAQIFMLDRIPTQEEYKLIVLDPPKWVIVNQRTRRQAQRDLDAGKHIDWTFEQLWKKKQKNSEDLYKEFEPWFEEFKRKMKSCI